MPFLSEMLDFLSQRIMIRLRAYNPLSPVVRRRVHLP